MIFIDEVMKMKQALGGSIPETKTITYPVWRDERRFLYSKKDILGVFSLWAVRQSPYYCPEKLFEAIEELAKKLDTKFIFDEDNLNFAIISCDEIREGLEVLFEEIDIIKSWNSPKSGHNAKYVFIDRYSSPASDDDFIDLGALARNIAHTLTLENLISEDCA